MADLGRRSHTLETVMESFKVFFDFDLLEDD